MTDDDDWVADDPNSNFHVIGEMKAKLEAELGHSIPDEKWRTVLRKYLTEAQAANGQDG